MLTKRKLIWILASFIFVILIIWIPLVLNCPNAGIALTHHARELHRLKNRNAIPQSADFDESVTLDALLRPGDDTNRWSTSKAAKIQGYVIDVEYARPEATNCYSPCRRDIHIAVARRVEATKQEQVIVEVTPNIREWADANGIDWSEQTLQAQLINHWCEFEGWLYLDVGHQKEAENTRPGRSENWRATAWEIHPVTRITVIK